MSAGEKTAESLPDEGSDEELRGILEEAERRKATAWGRTGRQATLTIAIPVGCLAAWAGFFLLGHDAGEEADSKPVEAARVAEKAQASQDIAELGAFLPDAVTGKTPPKDESGHDGIVTQEDIKFAVELMNFGRPPSAWKDTKE